MTGTFLDLLYYSIPLDGYTKDIVHLVWADAPIVRKEIELPTFVIESMNTTTCPDIKEKDGKIFAFHHKKIV